MIDYKDRLQAAMDRRGASVHELADALGTTYQSVKKVLGGRSGAFNAVNNALAARFLGVRSDWLAIGDGSMVEPAWPFPSIDEEKVRSLSHDDRIRLDAALLFSAAQLGLNVAAAKEKSQVA